MFLVNLLINSLAILLVSYILPGVRIESFISALFVAIVLGLVNTFIKPIILLFTLPINLLTLGLFTFIIDALMVLLTSAIIGGFVVENLLWALIFSLLVSLVNSILSSVVKN